MNGVSTAETLLIILVVLYPIPAIVATMRGHPNATAIGILNLFFGWTFLGWGAALIWSFTDPQRSTP